MTWKRTGLFLAAALAGVCFSWFPAAGGLERTFSGLLEAGDGLRQLSLSGAVGNLLAWTLVLGIAALPLLLLVLPRGRGRRCWEDSLLPMSSILFGVVAFFAANPSYLGGLFPELWLLSALGIWGTMLLFWVVLRLLRRLEEDPMEKVSRVLRVLLTGCAALLVFAAAGEAGRTILPVLAGSETEGLAAQQLLGPDRMLVQMPAASDGVVIALTLLEEIPTLLGAWVLLMAAGLVETLAENPFSGESAVQCEATARQCRLSIQWTLVLTLVVNLVWLTQFGIAERARVALEVPLIPLILSAALYLLCRCIQRGKALQDDNNSII